jgi:hypothetical protein
LITENPRRVRAEQVFPHYIRPLGAGFLALMLGAQLSTWIFALPAGLCGQTDFRHLYVAACMIRTGHRSELYNFAAQREFEDRLVSRDVALPFNHFADEAVVFLPYSYMSYRAGYLLFLLTNTALLLLVVWLMRPWTEKLRLEFPWLPVVMLAAFLPVTAALMKGQDSVIMLLLFTAAFALLDRRRPFLAGLLVGLGFFKFQIVIPVAALFFVWRRWRFVAGFAASSAVAVVVSLWIAGLSQMLSYAHWLLSMSVEGTAIDQARLSIFPSRMPNLRGLVYVLTSSFLPHFWVQALTGICSLVILLWVAIVGNKRNRQQQLLLAMTAAVLLSYHFYIYDLSLLLLPMVVLLDSCLGAGIGRTKFPSAVTALMFAAPVIVLVFSHEFIIAIPVLLFLAVLCGSSMGADGAAYSSS